jgi:hypothetical protein
MARAADEEVTAPINYLGPMAERPVFFAQQYHKNNLNLVAHEVAIRNFRDHLGEATLSTTGFELVEHKTSVSDFCSAEQVARAYIPEIRELIGSLTGARKVVVTPPVLRWSEREPHPERVNSRPGRFAHVDYSREAFHAFARSHLGDDPQAARWHAGRYAAFNIWRVMSQPPQDCPLGLLDRRSTSASDVIEGDAVIDADGRPEFRFGSSLYRANPRHRWGYFRDMRSDEAAVFLAYDSADDALPGVPHSAFDDPSCPGDAPPRASCEIRAYAYWG